MKHKGLIRMRSFTLYDTNIIYLNVASAHGFGEFMKI